MVAKIGLLLISNLVASATAQAQAPDQKQSGIVVIKNSWMKGVREPSMVRPIFDPNPRARNPAGTRDDPLQQMRRRMSMRVEGYFYKATIKNLGTKAVKAVAWDYTVAIPDDPKSLTHHQFYSRIKIGPGKHKEIYRFAMGPPTRTVAAVKGDARMIEEVVVNAVQYADGSVWKLEQ
jgi:hypothetical protein